MSKSEFAQAYTERMFPDIAAPAGYICLLYTSTSKTLYIIHIVISPFESSVIL